jgi:large subunit ribosomal protein L18
MENNKSRKKIRIKSTPERLRFSVYRSLNNIFVQIIDDASGTTKVSGSTLKYPKGNTIAAAEKVGAEVAQIAKQKGIEKILFDRGKYPYKGRIKAVAEAARKNGLSF